MPVDEGLIVAVTARLAACAPSDVRLDAVSYDWGSPATAGLWHATAGAPGRAASRAFVKLLRHPRLWPGLQSVPPGPTRDFFLDTFPWRFELDIVLSGIAEVLPPGMRIPRLLHHEALDEDHVAVWSELVSERRGPWSLAELGRAAQLLGMLAARRRDGAGVNASLPKVCHSLPACAALRYLVEGRVLMGAGADIADDELWRHPAMAAALEATNDFALREDLRHALALVGPTLDRLEALPQTFAHGDASIQNILVCHGEDDFVVIDWGFGSLLAVGFDIGQLLVGPMHAGLVDASQIHAIDEVIFPAYLSGLADEGWAVDPEQVRFGYLGSLFCRSAFTALPTAELRSRAAEDPGLEHLARQRLSLTRAMLDLTLPAVRTELEASGVV
ncbi:MAG: phosphotransferase [Terracoccus sp.]